MSTEFPFQIGDKIANKDWSSTDWVLIEWRRGDAYFAGVDESGCPYHDCPTPARYDEWWLWSPPVVRKQWLVTTERQVAPGVGSILVMHVECPHVVAAGSGLVDEYDVVVSVVEQP